MNDLVELLNAVWDRIVSVESAHSTIDPNNTDAVFTIPCEVSSHIISPGKAIELLERLEA